MGVDPNDIHLLIIDPKSKFFLFLDRVTHIESTELALAVCSF